MDESFGGTSRRVRRIRRPSISGRLRRAGVGAAGVLLAASSLLAGAAGPAAAATGPTHALLGRAPVLPADARVGAVLPAGQVVSGDVVLAARNAASLASWAANASTAGRPGYHHWLTPAAFAADFAPAPSTVASVEQALRAGGLTVPATVDSGLLVGFRGSAAAVERTFHTPLTDVRMASGRMAYANLAAATLDGVAPGVATGVVGLNDLVVPQATPVLTGRKGAGGVRKVAPPGSVPAGAANACGAASGVATSDGGLTDTQVATSYGLDPLYASGAMGAGQKIDILDLYYANSPDIASFDKCYFGSQAGAVQSRLSVTPVDGGANGDPGNGGTGETTLDIEDAQAFAPQASIDVFEAPQTNPGFLDVVAAMTADTASSFESISYGSCEPLDALQDPGFLQAENLLFEQAAAEGKTVLASSGDSGSDACAAGQGAPTPPAASVSDPASQPYVLAVGGTAITADSTPPAQTVWNDGPLGGSAGGGVSSVWPAPAWQQASTVPGINSASSQAATAAIDGSALCNTGVSTPGPCRQVPDVSALASPNVGGITVYLDGQFTVIGGTSSATPMWAAILADIASTPACRSAGGLGFVSPALYAIASVPAEYRASFTDVTSGNNDMFGSNGGLYAAGPGYDLATGLGTPQVTGAGGARGLAYYLCVPPAPAPTVSGVNPPAVSSAEVASGQSLTVTGTGFGAPGAGTVVGAQIGGAAVPASDITVDSPTQLTIDHLPPLAAQAPGLAGQDGTGTWVVAVTVAGGATSAPSPGARLIEYASGTNTAVTPEVAGTNPPAGPDAGGQTVTVYGSGFTQGRVLSVTFGGRPATSFSVIDDNRITAVVPSVPSGSCQPSDSPATGTCQVQVQVTTTAGASVEGTIPPEYSGPVTLTTAGPGTVAAATEYDYEPVPTISSIDFGGAPPLASEHGGTTVTIHGTGLGLLGFEWVNFGNYRLDTSATTIPYALVSTTAVTLAVPPIAATATPVSVPVTVQTFGSPNNAPGVAFTAVPPSNSLPLTYAPSPSIARVVPLAGALAGPTTGGTPLELTGTGFTGVNMVGFQDPATGAIADQFAIDVAGNGIIKLRTPATISGTYQLVACNPTGCSPGSQDVFTFFPPGNPQVLASFPRSGSAGTKITVVGRNLSDVVAVYIGKLKATHVANVPGGFAGDPYAVLATIPKGYLPGTTVFVRVVTLESQTTGFGATPGTDHALFTYR